MPKHYANADDFCYILAEFCCHKLVRFRQLFCAERNLNGFIRYWIVNEFRNVAWIAAQFSIGLDLFDFEFIRRSLPLKTAIVALNLVYSRHGFVRSTKDLNANRFQ